MAQLIGAVLGVFLLSRLILRIIPGDIEFRRRAISDAIAGVAAMILGAWGLADGGPLQWHAAAASYIPAALIVLAFDRVRAAAATPREVEVLSSSVEDLAPAPPPATDRGSRAQRIRRWQTGLHGGQLAMLLLAGIPVGATVGLFATITGMEANDAVDQIARGEYEGSPSIVQLGDLNFEVSPRFPSENIPELQRDVAQARADGVGIDSLIAVLGELGFDHKFYLSTLPELTDIASNRAWAWPAAILGVGLVLFCLHTLWVWLGARAKPPASV